MSTKLITAAHTQKLGHSLQEIRERALYNIKSKLDNGFTYDNELARSKEILTKLFEWFLYEPCTHQEIVFSLIKQVLRSESGQSLLRHYGTQSFKNEVNQIRRFLEPQFHQHLDEIMTILEESKVIVPPLETDIPLSYRTGQSDFNPNTVTVGTTATTIEGFIHQESSVYQQAGDDFLTRRSQDNFIIEPLQWQNLIEPDRHVLHSVQNSIKNSSDPGGVLHSAEFFSNVLLGDFPAEVFLQRPVITKGLLSNLKDSASSRLSIAILTSLYDLTRALQLRVNQYKDPCMYNCKSFVTEGFKIDSDDLDVDEDLAGLKRQQMSLPRFCTESLKSVLESLCPNMTKFSTKRKFNQVGMNKSLEVLEEVVKLLSLIMTNNIWKEKTSQTFMDIFRDLTEVMVAYGDVLEYFRIEVVSEDSSDLSVRAFQLCLLKNCLNFLHTLVPPSHCALVLPKNLKNTLTNSLVDVVLAKLYPDTHTSLLKIVESFSIGRESESIKKYKKIDEICKSVTSFMEFINCKSPNLKESVKLAENSMICFEFHKDLNFIFKFIEICATKLPLHPMTDNLLAEFERVTLKLLAHNVSELREEMYKSCRRKVASAIGPKLNLSGSGAPGAQILFLLRSAIFIEITTHGLTSDNPEIQRCAEDILIHIFKSKILVPDDIWDRIVEALIPSLPIILCFAGKSSSLGRTCLNLVDPDSARDLFIPEIEVIRGNVAILLSDDSQCREEAFSRICWLISSKPNSNDLLPRLVNLYDKALPNVCQISRPLEINRNRPVPHFYQPSSLQQVLDLLKSEDVEPVIRRSALTQIGVMTEDPLLHPTFLENSGIHLIIDIMQSALIERDFQNYPDSVIPAVTIFKNLCLYNPITRRELALNVEVFFCVLRGFFMFFTEDKMRQDGAVLLFLLTYRDFIIGSPSKGDFSIPEIVLNKMKVPLICKSYWKESPHTTESLQELILADSWALSSIQIQWNSELCGGIGNLLKSSRIEDVPNNLKLRTYDLELLKAASIKTCMHKYLTEVQNSTTHTSLIDSINKLTTYLLFYKIYGCGENLVEMPWKSTFSRFLRALPSGEGDEKLLMTVLKFLHLLSSIYKYKSNTWLSVMLKNPSNILFGLFHTAEPDEEENGGRLLCQNFLKLIKLVATNEENFLNRPLLHSDTNEVVSNWSKIVEKLSSNLKFDETLRFYNLSYLDSLLSCLVHLTATYKWFEDTCLLQVLKLVTHLLELAVCFHRGKGSITTVSVMGLSVTRNVILIINHIVSEMINLKLNNWESCFTGLVLIKRDWMMSFLVHRSSRDVVLRAATYQFFAGLAKSPRLAVEIVNDLKTDNQNVWQITIATLMDEDEASIVKESCANLLTSLTSHCTCNSGSSHLNLLPGLVPKSGRKNDVTYVLKLLEDSNFYKNLVSILYNLYTNRMIGVDALKKLTEYNNIPSSSSTNSGGSSGSLTSFSMTTPTLVKNLAVLVENVLKLSPNEFSNHVQENGLVKLFFRCLCNPTIDTSDLKRMSLYCDILEMDSTILSLLRHLALANQEILGTILHTRDCLTVVMSLLNPKCYDTSYPQLLFLRNKLWSQVLNLIVALSSLDDNNQRHTALTLLLEAIGEAGSQAFFETLCETLKPNSSNDLRSCALSALISLSEIDTASESVHKSSFSATSKSSLKELLDSPQLDRGDFCSDSNSKSTSISLLEDVYFKKRDGGGDCFECTVAGAEICKILLNLYDLCSLKADKKLVRQKSLIVGALTSVLGLSRSAKKLGLNLGLLQILLKRLGDFNLELGLESVDLLRRVSDKKRLLPLLQELDELIGLATNFMAYDEEIKMIFAENGLSDLVHKLWAWFATQKSHQLNVMKMLATFTNDCPIACQSVALTSSVGGSGLRRVPGKISLLNALVTLIEKEMEHVSKTHDLTILNLAFHVISNCCCALDCRNLLGKSSLLQGVGRLHPAVTKRQTPWESVEKIWLDFLQVFSLYPEGQSSIAKVSDVFELMLALTLSSKHANKLAALLVLRNISFHQPNRARLLISCEFINILRTKLECGSEEEKTAVVIMIWALAANNQKAKITFKSAQLDLKLQQILKHYELRNLEIQDTVKVDRVRYVLNMIRDN